MSKTTQQAFDDLDKAMKDFKAQILKDNPFLRIFPSPFDKNGSMRLLVCIAYAAIAMTIIDGTAFLIELIRG